MKTNNLMLFSFAAVVGLCFAPMSHAFSYTVDLQQTAPNKITATGSGSLDLAGLTFAGTSSTVDLIAGENTASNTGEYFLSTGSGSYDEYTGITGTAADFGGGTASEIGTGSGDFVGINTFSDDLFVPTGYTGGTLNSSATFTGDFGTLRLVDGTSFTYNLPSGDTFTIDVGNVAATPEPGSLVLLGTGLLGFAGVVRRRLS